MEIERKIKYPAVIFLFIAFCLYLNVVLHCFSNTLEQFSALKHSGDGPTLTELGYSEEGRVLMSFFSWTTCFTIAVTPV